ncbi:hypothetical protein H9P43_009726 [Blastocladiella emersonii ATCC 22665]|nr:hypothetical protein H9P43_009726 [Blastocladiella emersonii ATCC 22665]
MSLVWESPSFPGAYTGRVIGPKAAYFKAVQAKFPGLRLRVEPHGELSATQGNDNAFFDSPHVVRVFAHADALVSVDCVQRIFEPFLAQLATAFPATLHAFEVVPDDKFALQLELIPDGDRFIGVFDTPPPYYRLVPAAEHCLPLAAAPISADDLMASEMTKLSLHRTVGQRRPYIDVLKDGTHRDIAVTLVKRRSEILAWAATRAPKDFISGNIVQLKASLGELIFHGPMKGRMHVAAPAPYALLEEPAYKFLVGDLSKALEGKELKTAFNTSMPDSATDAVLDLLKHASLGFECTSSGEIKLIAKFRLLTADMDALAPHFNPYAVQNEYRAEFSYEPATAKRPARIGLDGVRLNLVSVDKYSVATPGGIGFRVRQAVQMWDSSTANGSVHPAALQVAGRVGEYLTENIGVIAQLAFEMRDGVTTNLTLPVLDDLAMAGCASMVILLEVGSQYVRDATAVSVTRITSIVSQYDRQRLQNLQVMPTGVMGDENMVPLYHQPTPVNTQITAHRFGYGDLSVIHEGAGTDTSDAEETIIEFMQLLELLAAEATKATVVDGSLHPAA